MNLRVEFSSGKISSNEWAGVYGFDPLQDDSVESAMDLQMFAVIGLKTEASDMNLERIGKMLLENIQEHFFNSISSEKNLIEKLEDSLWKIKAKIEVLLSKESELFSKGLDIEMSLIIVGVDILYAAVVGESKIFLMRGDKFVDISKALVDKSMAGFAKTGSLKLEGKDRVCLATSKISGDAENIRSLLNSLDVNLITRFSHNSGEAVMMIASGAAEWKEIPEESNVVVESEQFQNEPVIEETLPKLDIPSFEEQDSLEYQVEEEPNNFLSENLEVQTDLLPVSEKRYKRIGRSLSKVFSKGANKVLGLGTNLKNKMLSRKNNLLEVNDESRLVKILHEDHSESSPENFVEYAGVKTNFLQKILSILKSLFEFIVGKVRSLIKFIKNNDKNYAKYIRDFFSFLANSAKKILEFFKREFFGTADRRDMYLRGDLIKRNRKFLLAFLLVLGVILFFGIKDADFKRREGERVAGIRTSVSLIQSDAQKVFSKAKASLEADEATKSQIITELDSIVKKAETQKKDSLFIDDLNRIIAEGQSSKDLLLGVVEINDTNVKVVVDIGKQIPETKLEDMAYSSNYLFVSDSAQNAVYRIAPVVNSKIEPILDFIKPSLLAVDSSSNIVVYDDNISSSLSRIIPSELSFSRLSGPNLTDLGEVKETTIYTGNDALYELRPSPNNYIYKREPQDGGFLAGGTNYTTNSPPAWRIDGEYSSAIDIASPYEIYVLIKGQGIKRYLSGGDNTITRETYKGLFETDFQSLSNASSFDVSGLLLAVGDPSNQRILLFRIEENEQKSLVYLKQYIYRGNSNVFRDINEISIVESSAGSTPGIYVLDGSRIIGLQI